MDVGQVALGNVGEDAVPTQTTGRLYRVDELQPLPERVERGTQVVLLDVPALSATQDSRLLSDLGLQNGAVVVYDDRSTDTVPWVIHNGGPAQRNCVGRHQLRLKPTDYAGLAPELAAAPPSPQPQVQPAAPQEQAFWLVWSPTGATPPRFRHGSEREARAEAERLSACSRRSEFYVLRAISKARTVRVETVELAEPADADTEIPF